VNADHRFKCFVTVLLATD